MREHVPSPRGRTKTVSVAESTGKVTTVLDRGFGDIPRCSVVGTRDVGVLDTDGLGVSFPATGMVRSIVIMDSLSDGAIDLDLVVRRSSGAFPEVTYSLCRLTDSGVVVQNDELDVLTLATSGKRSVDEVLLISNEIGKIHN